jgi:hypothetical protein
MGLKTRLVGAAAAAAFAAMIAGSPAFAGTHDDGVFTITATESQLTTTVPGAKTFADSDTFAGYTGSVVTPVATITGGALNPGGSTNPDTGIDGSIANYLSASNGVTETITFNTSKQYFGMLWGSVDVSNTVSLFEGNTLVASYTGQQLENNSVALQPFAAPGSFVDFVADGSAGQFNKIVLSEGATFFETDNYAAAGVPEPATWAMMLAGFGGLGAAMRSRRRAATATA